MIYGNTSSSAIAAVSNENFESTLAMVGHKVSSCGNPAECKTALADGKFDVVLADPSDASNLKGTITPRIVPVVYKPSKDIMGQLNSEYAAAFDASRDALRLLPVLTKATKSVH